MEFLMILLVFPAVSFIFGIVGQILIKKMYIVIGINALIWLIATFTLFNETFLIWVFIYSALCGLGSGIINFKENK